MYEVGCVCLPTLTVTWVGREPPGFDNLGNQQRVGLGDGRRGFDHGTIGRDAEEIVKTAMVVGPRL